MAIIDLTHIIYRAHESGDSDEPKNIPNVVSGINKISFAGIKFRTKEFGDAED